MKLLFLIISFPLLMSSLLLGQNTSFLFKHIKGNVYINRDFDTRTPTRKTIIRPGDQIYTKNGAAVFTVNKTEVHIGPNSKLELLNFQNALTLYFAFGQFHFSSEHYNNTLQFRSHFFKIIPKTQNFSSYLLTSKDSSEIASLKGNLNINHQNISGKTNISHEQIEGTMLFFKEKQLRFPAKKLNNIEKVYLKESILEQKQPSKDIVSSKNYLPKDKILKQFKQWKERFEHNQGQKDITLEHFNSQFSTQKNIYSTLYESLIVDEFFVFPAPTFPPPFLQ